MLARLNDRDTHVRDALQAGSGALWSTIHAGVWMRSRVFLVAGAIALGCSTDRGGGSGGIGTLSGPTSGTGDEGGATGTDDTDGATSATSRAATTEEDPKLDVAFDTEGDSDPTDGPANSCKVVDDMDAVGDCRMQAPADSFAPVQQWEWWGPNGNDQSSVIPLVANFTDDNGDGEVDLCDVPDVVVVLDQGAFTGMGTMWLLDGATGTPHFEFAATVNGSVTPAVGDIDGDDLPEVVTSFGGNLIAFENDGSVKWQAAMPHNTNFYAIALADLDNDGDVEIIAGTYVADHQGAAIVDAPDWVWTPADPIYLSATAAADLDDDGDLEVVVGRRGTTTERCCTTSRRRSRATRRSRISTTIPAPRCSSRANKGSPCSSTTAP